MDVFDYQKIFSDAEESVVKATDEKALEEARVRFLGRKGQLFYALHALSAMPVEARRTRGPMLQGLKADLVKLFEGKRIALAAEKGSVMRRVDLTAPGKRARMGRRHPLTLVEEEVKEIFRSMNFSVVEGPEIESEYYNFDALHIPENHPAREMWDTFWVRSEQGGGEAVATAQKNNKSGKRERFLLRTHTSPVQVRYMETHTPPFQIIAPGRVFRYEATDASHEINFYQVEGLMVGKHVTLANFKFIIEQFFKKFFKDQRIEYRFRPSYFPFTEPSIEVDFKFSHGTSGEKGKNKKTKSSAPKEKWLEIMGAGMVHPQVFEYAHYNPRVSSGGWQGFAFGASIDRLAMIKYKIPDIRVLYSGDVRLIKQF